MGPANTLRTSFAQAGPKEVASAPHSGKTKGARPSQPLSTALARVLDKSALYDGRARFQKIYPCKHPHRPYATFDYGANISIN